ncbi:response regulator [bacterium]|nr:response regulator [bacterium]
MSQPSDISIRKPSAVLSVAIFVVFVSLMGWLRLVIYPDRMIALTYGLPLIICLWHRDMRLLWSMVFAFALMSAYKAFFLLPKPGEIPGFEVIQWGMHLVNLILIGWAVHAIARLMRKVERRKLKLERANKEIYTQNRELESQTEELRVQAEELEQQNEELRQQSEELEQQREELQEQNEDLNALNLEIAHREAILMKMLDSVHALEGEQAVLDEICRALLAVAQGRAVASGVLEVVEGECVLCAKCGFGNDGIARFPHGDSLAAAVMQEDKTGYIEDLLDRPDIIVPCPQAMRIRSVLAAPLHLGGRPAGAIELYSDQPRQWTPEEFALVEWAAAKSSLALEIMRLQKAVLTAKVDLERSVEARTAELNQTVETLCQEIQARTEIEQDLRRRTEQLRALAGELALTEQRERQRLAQVLHDGLQQLLAGARLRLNLLERARPENVGQMAAEIGDLLDDAIQTSRSLTAELCPPILREGGLIPALQWLARWMDARQRLAVELDVHVAVQPPEDMTIILFQTVRELLFNVVKHSGVNKARVRVARRADNLEIVVADEGVGFDPATDTDAGESGSYGLFSVRERLQHLGGSLEVHSAPGKGTRIVIAAPLPASAFLGEQPMFSEMEIPCPSLPVLVPGGDGSGPIRIMVVDDHLVMLQGLSMLIGEQADMKIVAEASSGEQAIDMARKARPSVILMDISMPGMNGIEATRRIHAEFPGIQIIGLSMFEESDRAEAMRTAGAARYLPKTAPASDLVAAIRACAARRTGTNGCLSPSPE